MCTSFPSRAHRTIRQLRVAPTQTTMPGFTAEIRARDRTVDPPPKRVVGGGDGTLHGTMREFPENSSSPHRGRNRVRRAGAMRRRAWASDRTADERRRTRGVWLRSMCRHVSPRRRLDRTSEPVRSTHLGLGIDPGEGVVVGVDGYFVRVGTRIDPSRRCLPIHLAPRRRRSRSMSYVREVWIDPAWAWIRIGRRLRRRSPREASYRSSTCVDAVPKCLRTRRSSRRRSPRAASYRSELASTKSTSGFVSVGDSRRRSPRAASHLSPTRVDAVGASVRRVRPRARSSPADTPSARRR